MASNSVKRKFPGILAAAMFVIAIFVFFLIRFFSPGKEDLSHFKVNADRLLARARTLLKTAQTFKQSEVLKRIGKSPVNGFYYRFDDHIDDASFDRSSFNSLSEPYLLNIEFDESESIQLQAKGEKYSIERGILKIDHQPGGYFEVDVGIPFEKLGEIEIRAKHRKGKILRFGWDKKLRKKMSWRNVGFTDVDVIPDNKFHTYTINARYIFLRRLRYGDTIKKFFLFVSDVNIDNVDVDYIRFISKKARYLQNPVGTIHETKKNEMRRVLFSRTPLAVTYAIEIPNNGHFMTFGMGILENANPVTFKIIINGAREIFSRQVISAEGWHDARIDMSPYAGQKLQMIFKTESRPGNVAFWSNPILYAPAKEKFNVILVLEDALRADHMSCYGYHRPTTPVKEKFAKKGVLFLNSFAQATKTRPSCPSIMTSFYPTAIRVWKYFEKLHENYITLAEILRHTGFRTASFIENGNAGPATGLHQGFSYLYKIYGKNNKTRNLYGGQVIEWIKKHNTLNYFLYLHLTDPHGPYDPPEKFRHWYNDSHLSGKKLTRVREFDPPRVTSPTREGRRARYDGEIKNNDFYFERFLNDLKDLNSLDHTLIIFISDHGEHLGEHDLWGHHPPGFVQGIKIPMIMVYPERLPRNRVITQTVQNLDILPTILDLAGIDHDDLLLAGDSLLPLIRGENMNFWENRIIVSDEVHNRGTREDRRELASIIYKDTHILISDKHPVQKFNYFKDKEEIHGITIFGKLKKFYKRFIRELQGNNFAIWQSITKNISTRIKYDPETIEHLKSLGYIK